MTTGQISNRSAPDDVLICLIPSSNIEGFSHEKENKRTVFPKMLGKLQQYKWKLKRFVMVVRIQEKSKLWFLDFFEMVS